MKTADEKAPAAQARVEPGTDKILPGDLMSMREVQRCGGPDRSTLWRWGNEQRITIYGVGARGAKLVSFAEACAVRDRNGTVSLSKAREMLQMWDKELRALCESGAIRATKRSAQEWQIDLEEVNRLRGEREALRAAGRDWVSLAEAERRGFKREWLLELHEQGELEFRYGPHRAKLVNIARLDELADVWSGTCPACDKPTSPGYRCHARCTKAVAEAGWWAHYEAAPWRAQQGRRMSDYWASPDGQAVIERMRVQRTRRRELPCCLCGEAVVLANAWIEIREREKRRTFCPTCWALWNPAYLRVSSIVRPADQRKPLSRPSRDVFRRALAAAEAFEEAYFQQLTRPQGGRRRKLALDLVIEALHVHAGFSDAAIGLLVQRELGQGDNERYVKTRRARARILRPEFRKMA